MAVKYAGKIDFKCQMCDAFGRDQYIAKPEVKKLVNWESLLICKKCAKREVGSRNKKGWDRAHDLGRNV